MVWCSVAKDPEKIHEETLENIERHNQAMVETYKLEFEIHKTQATLVAGSLVAIIALSELLVQEDPRYTLALAASGVLLLYSMVWAIATMLGLTTAVMLTLSPWSSQEDKDKQKDKLQRSRWQSMVAFGLGIGLFGFHVYANRFL